MFNTIQLYEKDIYKAILDRITHEVLLDCVKNNKVLHIKFRGVKITKKNCSKELIIQYILELYPQNSKIQNMLQDMWRVLVKRLRTDVFSLNTRKEVEEYLDSEYDPDLLIIATLLMIREEKDLNVIGEELFNRYLDEENGNDENFEEISDNKISEEEFYMDNNIIENSSVMNLSLGECIAKLKNFSEELEYYKNENTAKEEKIIELNKSLDEEKKIIKQQKNDMKNLVSKIDSLEKEVKSKFKCIEDILKSSTGSISKQITEIKLSENSFEKSLDKKFENINKGLENLHAITKTINLNEQVTMIKDSIKEVIQAEIKNLILENSSMANEIPKVEEVAVSQIKSSIDPEAEELLKELEDVIG